MSNSVLVSVFSLFLLLSSTSFHALGQTKDNIDTGNTNSCNDMVKNFTDDKLRNCLSCVLVLDPDNKTCKFFVEDDDHGILVVCRDKEHSGLNETRYVTETDCQNEFGPKPSPKPVVPTNPTTTTLPLPTTASITSTRTPATVPSTSNSPPSPKTSTASPKPQQPTTTKVPTPSSKGTTTTTKAPSRRVDGGGFSFGTFFGGIMFTLAVSSVAYVAFRFYKARTARNYHTLSANLI